MSVPFVFRECVGKCRKEGRNENRTVVMVLFGKEKAKSLTYLSTIWFYDIHFYVSLCFCACALLSMMCQDLYRRMGQKEQKNLPLKEHKHTSENIFDLCMGKGKPVFSIRFNSHVFPHFLLLLQWIGADKLLYSFTWVRDYCINSMEMIHSSLAMKMKKKWRTFTSWMR